ATLLSEYPFRTPQPDWGASRVAAVRDALIATYDDQTRSQMRLIDTIVDTLPDAIIAGDSTSPVYAGNFAYDAPTPRSWFNSSTGYGTLGYGLPPASGAQLPGGG